MKLKPKIGIVFTSIEGIDADQEKLIEFKDKFMKKINGSDMDIIRIDFTVSNVNEAGTANGILKQNDPDVICIAAAVWTPDTVVIRLIENLSDVPVILFTTSLSEYTIGINGAQIISSSLTELDREYRFIFGSIDDESTMKKILSYATACALAKSLKNLRIGIVGGRLSIMANLSADEFGIKNIFGSTVIPIDFGELEDFLKNVDSNSIKERINNIKKTIKNITVEDSVLEESVKYFFAFKNITEFYGLGAITVNCYPFPYIKAKTCLAASNLNDIGITYACESDVNSAIIMHMMKSITGVTALNSDLIIEDSIENSIMFSHCGCGPFSLADSTDDVRLQQHFEVKKGMAVYYPLKRSGRNVTVVNLVGRENTYRICILKGVTTETKYLNYCGNPVSVKFKTGVGELINRIGNEGFGHHWMVAFDDCSDIFEDFCKILNIWNVYIE
jgi:L-fucose isomerase-like protein